MCLVYLDIFNIENQHIIWTRNPWNSHFHFSVNEKSDLVETYVLCGIPSYLIMGYKFDLRWASYVVNAQYGAIRNLRY